MNCCNDFGACTNGHNCPARNVPTVRERVEAEHFGIKPAKNARVGRRYPAAPGWAPSHWPKTLRALAKWMLIVVLMSMAAGFIVGTLA